LKEVDGTNGVAEFIAVEKTNLEIGFDYSRIGGNGFLKLFNGRGVVEVSDIFARLAKERIPFVFGVRSWRSLLARGEDEGGQEGGEKRFVHSAIMITRRRFRKPRV
jgi:hypothetical protein